MNKQKEKNFLPIIQTVFPSAVAEYKFHPVRRWRADYAIPNFKILIEIEGGVWVKGRHTRGSGYIKDMEKYNAAGIMGYTILRYTPQQIGQLLDDLKEIKERAWT
jgi:very-short-patch-repair endonuclease